MSGCGGRGAGREEYLVVFAGVEADTVEVVEVIAGEVDFAVLEIAEGNAVVDHACVLGTETAQRDSLHASGATVVAEVDAGKPAHGVGNVGDAPEFYLLGVNALGLCGGFYGVDGAF